MWGPHVRSTSLLPPFTTMAGMAAARHSLPAGPCPHPGEPGGVARLYHRRHRTRVGCLRRPLHSRRPPQLLHTPVRRFLAEPAAPARTRRRPLAPCACPLAHDQAMPPHAAAAPVGPARAAPSPQ
ncbi:hypothetical protein PVAP13_9KG142985 [Panicum virgatum]|uniref:Uncharacterized protein n=1 Tax=Panicum virgatum TaxID=38727 RepID=A0A8T0NLH0_PANVG|nr:hypothetical protein PVAP13_9KG142985 [Panicum virgatum]